MKKVSMFLMYLNPLMTLISLALVVECSWLFILLPCIYLGSTLTFFCRAHADEFAEIEKRNEYLKDKTKYKCIGMVCEYYGDMNIVYKEIATGKMIYT